MGFTAHNVSLPNLVACPFCNEMSLYIYDDTLRDDLWFNCNTCAAHGNIITFAAQIWNTDIAEVLNRFLETGICNKAVKNDTYLKNIEKYWIKLQKVTEIWQKSKEQLWTIESDWILHKLRDLGVSRDIPCDGLIGAVDARQLCALHMALGAHYPKTVRDNGSALILPYCDFPGRICGFLTIKSGKDFNISQRFISLNAMNRLRPDAGYYLIETSLLPAHPVMQNNHLIVDDALWVIKAQTTQLRHGLPLLPISASYCGADAASLGGTWASLPAQKKFFHSEHITPEIVSQAAAARGYICIKPPANFVETMTPAHILRHIASIRRNAVTWQAALTNVYSNLNKIAMRAFLKQLTIPRVRLEPFLKTKTALSVDDIAEVFHQMLPRRESGTLYIQNTDYIVREDGWYSPRGIPILNCCPVIKNIIYTDTGKKYYAGHVTKSGKKIDFLTSAKALEKVGLFEFLSVLLAQNNELLIGVSNKNRHRLLANTISRQQPQINHVCTKLGWNDKLRRFNLGNYAINNDGTLIDAEYPELLPDHVFNFPPPNAIAPVEIDTFLTPAHENAFVWACVSAALAQIIAPIINADQTSVAITPENFATATAIGLALGGNAHRIKDTTNINIVIKAMCKTAMPTFIELPTVTNNILRRLLIRGSNTSAFIKLNARNLPAALSYGWLTITSNTATRPRSDYSTLSYIVPAYIQRVLKQRLSLHDTKINLVLSVLNDVHKWLDNIYGKTFNIAAALQIILPAEKAHVMLMREINNAITAERIAVLPRPRFQRQNPDYLIRDKNAWWLNKKAIDKYLKSAGVVPDWNALINCFTQQGVFIGETVIQNMSGLLIDKSWCDAFWSDYKNITKKRVS